jgi:uncharacterized protein (DUF342 family)
MQVQVSKDGNEARVLAVSPDFAGGGPVTVANLKAELEKQGVRAGTREDALESLANALAAGEGYSGKPILVASGKPPGVGTDGKLVLSPPTETDLKKDHLSWIVFPGAKVATLIPPTVGEPGVTVQGEEISGKPGKRVKLRLGKGVHSVRNGQDIVATAAGFVQFDWKSISVKSPVTISRDKLSASLTVFAPQKIIGDAGVEQYNKLLKSSGVVHGIDQEVIEKTLQEATDTGEDQRDILVAQGTNPIRGEDAAIEYKFDHKVKPGLLLEGGKMDYRERDLVKNVAVDQELAVKIPATPGTPGTTVTGEALAPQPGKDLKLRALENVDLSSDGVTLVAKREGMAALDRDGGVRVVTEFVLRGDVDYATGNVRCKGSVKIEGSVLPEFSVESDQDVTIEGGVDAANVRAGGNLFVGYGIHGSPDTQIAADGEVHALFIEAATVRAKGNVVLGQSLRHSNVRTGEAVKATERKGAIVGGPVFATRGILANELGSERGTRTELVVGVDTSKLEQLETLEKKIDECDKTLRRVDTQLGPALGKGENVQLHAGKKSWLEKLLKERAKIVAERDEATEKRNRITQEMRTDLSARVRALKKVYPGVVVRIGEATYSVGDIKEDVTFSYDEARAEIACTEGGT